MTKIQQASSTPTQQTSSSLQSEKPEDFYHSLANSVSQNDTIDIDDALKLYKEFSKNGIVNYKGLAELQNKSKLNLHAFHQIDGTFAGFQFALMPPSEKEFISAAKFLRGIFPDNQISVDLTKSLERSLFKLTQKRTTADLFAEYERLQNDPNRPPVAPLTEIEKYTAVLRNSMMATLDPVTLAGKIERGSEPPAQRIQHIANRIGSIRKLLSQISKDDPHAKSVLQDTYRTILFFRQVLSRAPATPQAEGEEALQPGRLPSPDKALNAPRPNPNINLNEQPCSGLIRFTSFAKIRHAVGICADEALAELRPYLSDTGHLDEVLKDATSELSDMEKRLDDDLAQKLQAERKQAPPKFKLLDKDENGLMEQADQMALADAYRGQDFLYTRKEWNTMIKERGLNKKTFTAFFNERKQKTDSTEDGIDNPVDQVSIIDLYELFDTKNKKYFYGDIRYGIRAADAADLFEPATPSPSKAI